MNKKYKLLTIGQFAAMHGINKKTLMWYDSIGLFQPVSNNPENGYRYYSYQQSSILETILLLRELDVSIREIQGFIKNRSAENLKRLLDEKLTALDLQLNHLQAVRKIYPFLFALSVSVILIFSKKLPLRITPIVNPTITDTKSVINRFITV